jgi:hypothetical protein
MKPNKQIKVAPEFAQELDKIQLNRIKNNKDEKPVGDRLLTKKITKHESWKKIKEDLETFNLIDE